MKMVKIRFPDEAARAKGIAAIVRRGRVVRLPKHTFIVPAPALDVLNDMGLAYEVLAEGGWDSAVHALRDPASAAVQ